MINNDDAVACLDCLTFQAINNSVTICQKLAANESFNQQFSMRVLTTIKHGRSSVSFFFFTIIILLFFKNF